MMAFIACLFPLTPLENRREQQEQGDVRHALPALRTQLLGETLLTTERREERAAWPLFSLLATARHPLALRVSLLEEASPISLSVLLDTLLRPGPILLGDRRYALQARDALRGGWTGVSTWADFLTPTTEFTIQLHLGTPLILPHDARAEAGPVSHFPVPTLLFPTLARRWHALGGPPLPLDQEELLAILEDGSLVLADYRLQATPLLLASVTPLGFRGWITYHCRTKKEAARATLVALARFAFFAGFGSGTEHGMGVAQVEFRERGTA